MTSLIIFPTTKNVFHAGIICRKKKLEIAQIFITARSSVTKKLVSIITEGNCNKILIIAPFQDDPDLQQILHNQGLKKLQILWYGDSTSKTQLQLNQYSQISTTTATELPSPREVIENYLKYKKALTFLGDTSGNLATYHIKEAIKHVVKDSKNIPEQDQAAVASFSEKDFPALEGRSSEMSRLKREIQIIAASGIKKILLLGESGTGKEAVALFLHTLDPSRKDQKFGSINCATLQEQFLISELFGHTKGSFTGATQNKTGLISELDGGTLFLDELPDLPPIVQAMLLRFLESGTYTALGSNKELKSNIKIIAAAQRTLLKDKIDSKNFRMDLYFRLAEKTIPLPSLSEIPEDIPTLVVHLAYKIEQEDSAKRDAAISYFYNRMSELKQHSWPGNVRELANYVSRRIKLGDEDNIDLQEIKSLLDPRELPSPLGNNLARTNGIPTQNDIIDVKQIETVEIVKLRYVKEMNRLLRKESRSQQEICNVLGISVNTLKKMVQT